MPPEKRPLPLVGEDTIEDDPTLGKPLDNFPSRRLRATLIGAVVLVPAAMLLNLALINVQGVWVAPFIVSVIALMALAVGWWIMHQWNREVILYERGFSYREGSENVPFLYAEVQAIRLRAEQLAYFGGLFRRAIYRVTIQTKAGDRIRLDNTYSRIDQLADKLVAHVNAILYPVVKERLQRGERIDFAGGLAISDEGIHIDAAVLENAAGDVVLPWARFSGYTIAQRQLVLLTEDEAAWFSVPLAEVDNLVLLLVILREQRSIEGSAA